MPVGNPVEGGGGTGGGGSSGLSTGSSGGGSGLDARKVKSLLIRYFPQLLTKFGGMMRPNNVMHAPLVLTAGGIVNRREITADYTLIEPDLLLAITDLTGLLNVQLIDRPEGQVVVVKDESGRANAFPITIYPPSGQLIDGASSLVISKAYESKTLYTDGDNWFTIERGAFDDSSLISETELLWLYVAALYGFILGEMGELVSTDFAEVGFEVIGAN